MTPSRTLEVHCPADRRGKWHVRAPVTGLPLCGAGVALDDSMRIQIPIGSDLRKAHPIVCRRCLRSAASGL